MPLMNKREIRRYIRLRKQAVTVAEILQKSEALAQLFLRTEEYRAARSLYGYLPFNQEVCTVPILRQAILDGKRVAVPKCCGSQLRFIWLEDLDAVEKNSMGIPEPVAEGPVADDVEALVLMPGVAFDKKGRRIGYGGGFYDRFLAREDKHPTVALCYDFQLFEQLETEEYDIPVDKVLWV